MIKKYIIALILLISTVCFGNTHESATTKQTRIMENFSHYILQHRQSPYGFTAVSMTMQCKNNPPINVFGGFTSTDNKYQINKNSLFHIGSVTKSFTSVVMLQVAQEYKINLDSDKVIAKYFPQYPKWGKITVRQLLNMTSGIPTYYNGLSNDVMKQITAKEFKNVVSSKTILNLVYKHSMNFKPGTKYEYSNTNYTLLGLLIEKITHHTMQYEVEKRIFNKLRMKHSYYVRNQLLSMPGVKKSDVVHCYAYFNGGKSPYSFMKYGQDMVNCSDSTANSAAGIVSTPSDINIYLHALYKPGVLLTKSQFKQFTTLVSTKSGKTFTPKKHPGLTGYGLGIFGYYSKSEHSVVYFYQGEFGCQLIYFYNPRTQMHITYAINSMKH